MITHGHIRLVLLCKEEVDISQEDRKRNGKHFSAVSLEDLLPQVGLSQYRLIRLAMIRALEIHDGSPPLVDFHPSEKATTIALREIAQGRVNVKPGSIPQELTPEDT